MINDRRKTGMPRLDAILGGGFLPGLVFVRGDAAERFAQQLATAVDAHSPQSNCLCIERTLWTGELALHFLRTARSRDTVAFIYSHGRLGMTPEALDAVDVVLEMYDTSVSVTKNRGGSVGGVLLRETEGGAFVEREMPKPAVAPFRLRTGLPRLDALLGGGLLPGYVVVIGDTREAAQCLSWELGNAIRQVNPEWAYRAVNAAVEEFPAGDDLNDATVATDRLRSGKTVVFAYACPADTPTVRRADALIDTVLHYDGRTLRVAKNGVSGPCGSVTMREEDGALVEYDVPPFAEIERAAIKAADAADRVLGALTPEVRASLYSPMLHPDVEPALNAAFREGEAHAWASAVRMVDRYVGVFDDPEQIAVVDAILRDIVVTAKRKA